MSGANVLFKGTVSRKALSTTFFSATVRFRFSVCIEMLFQIRLLRKALIAGPMSAMMWFRSRVRA